MPRPRRLMEAVSPRASLMPPTSWDSLKATSAAWGMARKSSSPLVAATPSRSSESRTVTGRASLTRAPRICEPTMMISSSSAALAGACWVAMTPDVLLTMRTLSGLTNWASSPLPARSWFSAARTLICPFTAGPVRPSTRSDGAARETRAWLARTRTPDDSLWAGTSNAAVCSWAIATGGRPAVRAVAPTPAIAKRRNIAVPISLRIRSLPRTFPDLDVQNRRTPTSAGVRRFSLQEPALQPGCQSLIQIQPGHRAVRRPSARCDPGPRRGAVP